MRGVFSKSLLACSLYDQRNRFFQLPFNGGHFVADSCSCFCSMLVTCDLYNSSFQLPLPRSENLEYWCDLSDTLFICFDQTVQRIFLLLFLLSNVSVCLVLSPGSCLLYCNSEACKTGFSSFWITGIKYRILAKCKNL